ncbi:DMT family transporter [Nocardioides cavernaquae]|uniref:QacE family quaternary ammonium compound efflux SMR transporter n=1 Tax=Nocardioides cavernaquae TaxID=2321396 RepID=A0A3A5H5E0_9ACTN|nr:multidrug efflux SMR transporter [Nocardioides cavernaquae]RJS45782.1 QacE family quaternary ammonium compound efflux SMR transporter [Nocardioides cavernaquae]
MYAALGLLFAAIALEVGASAALPRTQGFKDPLWTVFVVAGYAASIWLLALVVRDMPVSTAYAIWAGLGTAAVAVIGAVWLGDSLDPLKVVALGMVIVGVVVLNLQGAH